MSFIMDLINKIFDKNSVKTLPNGNPQSEFTNEKRNRNWLLPKTNNKTPLNELETSIKRFLLAYNYILEKNPQAYNSNCQNLAYHALTGLNGVPPTQLEFQVNAQNERNLLNYMRQNQNIILQFKVLLITQLSFMLNLHFILYLQIKTYVEFI